MANITHEQAVREYGPNPAELDPNDKWFCDHSCGFELEHADNSEHCYSCGYPKTIRSK